MDSILAFEQWTGSSWPFVHPVYMCFVDYNCVPQESGGGHCGIMGHQGPSYRNDSADVVQASA